MPADSKMDPPLGKVEAMRDCGSASGITDLRKGLFNRFKRRVRCVKEATLRTTKSVKKKGKEMLQAPEQTPPAPHGSPCEADIQLQPMEGPALEEVGAQRSF